MTNLAWKPLQSICEKYGTNHENSHFAICCRYQISMFYMERMQGGIWEMSLMVTNCVTGPVRWFVYLCERLVRTEREFICVLLYCPHSVVNCFSPILSPMRIFE